MHLSHMGQTWIKLSVLLQLATIVICHFAIWVNCGGDLHQLCYRFREATVFPSTHAGKNCRAEADRFRAARLV